MENKNHGEVFNYTYSAKQKTEIESIRKKYLPPEEDKMTLLRKLDSSVYQKATSLSLIAGFIGAIVFGVGMCCCMVWMDKWFIPGIIIGIIGIGIIALAYPIYSKIIKKEREKIAPEIMRLTDELMKS
ncbi:MAG: hypothetical protein IJ460_02870 [Clostridia bacterium]|nr:hypothetical protein [Clostridia bacterium]